MPSDTGWPPSYDRRGRPEKGRPTEAGSLMCLRNGIYPSLLLMEFRREVVSVRPPDWSLRALAKVGAALGFKTETRGAQRDRCQMARRQPTSIALPSTRAALYPGGGTSFRLHLRGIPW